MISYYDRKVEYSVKKNHTNKLVISAIFAAICFVTTCVLAIPSFYTKGYINLGDVSVLITAYIIGGGYGAVAAGLGSALADMSMGFYLYIPVTFVIKALMVLISAFFLKKADCTENKKTSAIWVVTGVLLAELFMITGYFIFELFLYKMGAFASILGSSIQGGVCAVISVTAIFAIKGNTFVKRIKNILKD